MLTTKEKIQLIQENCKKHDITAYEIGLHTEISKQTAHQILTNKNYNPKNKTLNFILEYIENKILGTNTPPVSENIVQENKYSYGNDFRKMTLDEKLSKINKEQVIANRHQELINKQIEVFNLQISRVFSKLSDIEELIKNSK